VHRVRLPAGEERHLWKRGRVMLRRGGRGSRLLVVAQEVTEAEGLAGVGVEQPGSGSGRDPRLRRVAEEVVRLVEVGRGDLGDATAEAGEVEGGTAEDKRCAVYVIDDGAVRCVAARPLAVAGEDGVLSKGGVCGVALEKAALRREVAEVVATRQWILDILAHDMRAPLNHIALGAAMMVGEDAPAEKAVRYARIIQRSAFRMNRLIQDLLDVSATVAGSLTIDLRREEIGPLLDEVKATVELLGTSPLVVDIPAELPAVPVDRDRLLQVFFNLVANALKHSPEGAPLGIRVEVRDRELLFSVTDQGTGIPAERLDLIFEPYWCSPDSARTGGKGLGLAIARAIVEGHGGRIWAESESGSGSTFFFTIAR
jgi:signal transduction histidine kinase